MFGERWTFSRLRLTLLPADLLFAAGHANERNDGREFRTREIHAKAQPFTETRGDQRGKQPDVNGSHAVAGRGEVQAGTGSGSRSGRRERAGAGGKTLLVATDSR